MCTAGQRVSLTITGPGPSFKQCPPSPEGFGGPWRASEGLRTPRRASKGLRGPKGVLLASEGFREPCMASTSLRGPQ